jgi:hypothetical protein
VILFNHYKNKQKMLCTDALNDLGPPSDQTSAPPVDEGDFPAFMTQEMAQKAAADFQNMLKYVACTT